jgi:hypothetical protein
VIKKTLGTRWSPSLPHGYAEQIPLERSGGVFTLPVLINNVITLKFVLDSGAAEVSIPMDVALTLHRAGTIDSRDFLEDGVYQQAAVGGSCAGMASDSIAPFSLLYFHRLHPDSGSGGGRKFIIAPNAGGAWTPAKTAARKCTDPRAGGHIGGSGCWRTERTHRSTLWWKRR